MSEREREREDDTVYPEGTCPFHYCVYVVAAMVTAIEYRKLLLFKNTV